MAVPVDIVENIDSKILDARNNAEDIAQVRAKGFEVDEDKDPSPENIPNGPPDINIGLYEGQS